MTARSILDGLARCFRSNSSHRPRRSPRRGLNATVEGLESRESTTNMSELYMLVSLYTALNRSRTPSHYVSNWGNYGQNPRVNYQTLANWNPNASVSPAQYASGYSTLPMNWLLNRN